MTCAHHLPVPEFVRTYRQADVDSQLVPWRATPFWRGVLRDHPGLLAELVTEIQSDGSISRSFVKNRKDPIELFLATMAWGGAWHSSQVQLLTAVVREPEIKARITKIIRTVRDHGAGEGWSALYLSETKVAGLGPSFGTKLLYFAGYGRSPGNQPLILDQNVMVSLANSQSVTGSTFEGCRPWYREWYERYLCLASAWASDPSWGEKPEVVEYGLFRHGKKLRRANARPSS